MAAALQWTEIPNSIPQEMKNQLDILVELLRDIDLESRMMTIIEADNLCKEWKEENLPAHEVSGKLLSIKQQLEAEFLKARQMLVLVEQAQYLLKI